jgi:hypothetical protein
MTSKTNAWENALLLLTFNNTNAANIGDATGLRGSSTAGQLFLSLHSADPGEAGNQSTSEISYTGYARLGINRASGAGGFTVTGNSVSPTTQPIDFGACTAGTATATHLGIGTASSGAGVLLYVAPLSASISIASPNVPRVSTLTGTEE